MTHCNYYYLQICKVFMKQAPDLQSIHTFPFILWTQVKFFFLGLIFTSFFLSFQFWLQQTIKRKIILLSLSFFFLEICCLLPGAIFRLDRILSKIDLFWNVEVFYNCITCTTIGIYLDDWLNLSKIYLSSIPR